MLIMLFVRCCVVLPSLLLGENIPAESGQVAMHSTTVMLQLQYNLLRLENSSEVDRARSLVELLDGGFEAQYRSKLHNLETAI